MEVIEKNKEEINKKSGESLNIKYILDLRDFPGDPYESKVVHDVEVIMNDPEVNVICETMGGIHPAYEFPSGLFFWAKVYALPIKNWWQTMGRNFFAWPGRISATTCLRPVWEAVSRLSARLTIL